MPVCHILAGIPCSGKTTYVRNNILHLDDYVILSTDDILEEMAEVLGMTYNEAWPDYYHWANVIFWERFHAAVAERKNIIIDRTNLTPKTRASVLSQLPKEYHKKATYFIPNIKVIDKRNVRPGKIIPKEVLWNMLVALTEPTHEEGFDGIQHTIVGA